MSPSTVTPASALSDDNKRRLFDLLARGDREPRPTARGVPKAPPGRPAPLSFEQELIWTHSQLAPELPLYNEILTVRRTGSLDVPTLERALSEVLRRHEAWRTTFDVLDDAAVQIVHAPTLVSLPVIDLSSLPEPEREREASRLASEEVRRPLDLVRGPIMRAKLVRLGEQEHRLYVVVHQIVHDGVSVYSVLLPELSSLYEAFAAGRPSPLRDRAVQYGDFASHQREQHDDEALDASLDYWRRQLADAPTALELPTDHARPSVQTFRGAQHSFTLPRPLTDALKRFSQREGVTLYVALLAAFNTLLHRYTGQEDLVVGTAVSTRKHADVEKLLGVFLNTIVLRTRLSEGQTFRSLLSTQRDIVVGGLSHGDVPFHRLVEHLQPKRDPGRNPLFQVTFVLEPPMSAPMPGWEMTQMDVDTGVARVDLYLQMDDRPEGLVGHIRYCTDLWERSTIVRMAEHFEKLLESVVVDPERSLASLPMLTNPEHVPSSVRAPSERPRHAHAFDRSEIEQSIPERFAKLAAKHAQRVAVRTSGARWTYDDLDRARRKVSRALRAYTPAAGSRVALLLDHDAPMVAGILGTLSSGCAYVPLDPAHPVDRLRRIVDDASPVALLTSARNVACARELAAAGAPVLEIEDVLRGPDATEVEHAVMPETLAYVLYTSGSTGQPKGVAQNHRNVLHFISAYTNNLRLGPDDRLTLLPSYGVDAAVMDVFAALLNGATLCPIDVREVGLRGVLDRLTEAGITVYHSTPTLYRHFIRELSQGIVPSTIRLVVLGGEEVRRSDLDAHRRHFAPSCTLVNGFGPTESTVSLQYFVDARATMGTRVVPIGRPVASTEVSLLSRGGVPGQVYGEIAIRSPYVALGYWQRPELTQAAFDRDLAGGATRVYKTGDIGRLLPDGNFEYCGRRDFQTKIRGFRVELGEIEATLRLHAGVTEAAAVVREVEGDKQVIAYFCARHPPAPSQDELRRFLRGRLPVHMVPSAFVCMDRLPWTTSGKLDRRALPDPEPTREQDHAPPQDGLEKQLAAIWAKVLGVARVSVHQDFFDLGGHSMMALRMMAQLETEFGVNLPLATLFEAPTVRRLADVLRPEVGTPRRANDMHTPAALARETATIGRVGRLLERLRFMAERARSRR